MDKKKKPRGRSEELGLVKAAAWAWYQHGSGSSNGNPTREFVFKIVGEAHPRPSRYKVEAMRMKALLVAEEEHAIMAADEEEVLSQQTISPVHTDNSLLDSYEIQSISKHLHCLIESTKSGRFYGEKNSVAMSSDGEEGGATVKKKKMKRNFKGFWPIGRAIVCGRREDVDTKAFLGGHRQHIPSAARAR